jgi:uncharacterized protein (TIGR02678 family)
MKSPQGSAGIGDLQQRHQREEFRMALRALLMQPLIGPQHPDFPAIRRQADKLREWITRETGWILHVEREGARLYKRPADLADATRGLPNYDRRRYALLCLVASVLERAEPQITLRVLGERLLALAAEPMFSARGFSFTLGSPAERRDLVTVCRTLLDLGILQRVAGDEEGYVHGNGAQADVLYDVQRRALAVVLAAVRGPSTWPQQDAPVTLEQRLHSLVAEHVADSDEGRRTALRHHLARRLLDDPVIYMDMLDAEALAYFINQRGAMAARLCEATGLAAEQRAEGLALTDDNGSLTDVAMPAEGTESHATLLVAEYLARRQGSLETSEVQIASYLAEARESYGRYWRKSAREAGSEKELANVAIRRLVMLQLIECAPGGWVRPRPALSRFALGEAHILRKPVA